MPYGVIYFANMPTVDNPTSKTLSELGVSDAKGVAEKFAEVRALFDAQAHRSMDSQNWEILRQSWVGRKSGVLTAITENWLKPAETELKRIVGQELNKFKAHLEKTLEERRVAIESGAEEAALAKERLDLSLPGVIHPIGSHHLIRQVFQEIEDIFFSIGFSVVEGPEIETPYYNFEALNIPEFHPDRDDMDTFYIELPKGAPKIGRAHV